VGGLLKVLIVANGILEMVNLNNIILQLIRYSIYFLYIKLLQFFNVLFF